MNLFKNENVFPFLLPLFSPVGPTHPSFPFSFSPRGPNHPTGPIGLFRPSPCAPPPSHPPFMAAAVPRTAGKALPLTRPPLFPGREEEEGRQNCLEPPPFFLIPLRALPFITLFPKRPFLFSLFANKPFHYMKIILNRSLLFPRVTLILSNIIIKPLP